MDCVGTGDGNRTRFLTWRVRAEHTPYGEPLIPARRVRAEHTRYGVRAELSELVNFRGVFSDPFGSEVGGWGCAKVTVVAPAVWAGTGMGRGRRRER